MIRLVLLNFARKIFSKRFRRKCRIALNNWRYERSAYKQNQIEISPLDKSDIRLIIAGVGNTVEIEKMHRNSFGKLKITIVGDGNKITIAKDLNITDELNITIGSSQDFAKVYGSAIQIGRHLACSSAKILTYNSGSKISIGNNCVFDNNVRLIHTDFRPILNANTREIVNPVRELKIGDNCWLGIDVVVRTNAKIPNNCVIDMASVVTDLPMVEKNVTWSGNIQQYIDNGAVQVPKILSPSQTLAEILNKKLSICRFGDGEFDIMLAQGNAIFQKSSDQLMGRLQEILKSNDERVMIGIQSGLWNNVSPQNRETEEWCNDYVFLKRTILSQFLNFDRVYVSTEISIMNAHSCNIDLKPIYTQWMQIWQDKDIVVIQGKGIFDKLKYNMFENAHSVEYLFAPNKNAFEKYDEILARAKTLDKNKLVLIVLGVAATVLAFDLAMSGYWALDIGHIVKDYNYYREGLKADEYVDYAPKFFLPD